jgi:transcriptional regulator with XRE-family HTH domain
MTGIGLRLRQERTRLKLSQSALGSIGGVETNAQGNYESGARSPKTDYLLRIAEAGVDLNYVLSGTRADPPPDDVEAKPVLNAHLNKVTHQLHRNLYGLIDALYQMAQLIEAKASDTLDEDVKNELDTIRAEAQSLAQASVRLIFVTSKLS